MFVAEGGNILNPSINGITKGATVMKRYVDGVLTNEPLWPWPMNERIKEAMVASGYDKLGGLDGKGGIDLTKTVFELGGTCPPEICGGTQDTEAPTTPANLQATTVSSSQINLSWNASADNVGVTGYKIYRDGTQITTTTTTSYSDTGLSPSTTYTYTVSALDSAGNESGQSASSQVTTAGDTTRPTITTVDAGAPNDKKVTVVFSEPIEQASAEAVANYVIDQGVNVSSASLGTDLKTVTLTTSTLSEGATYILTVNNVKDRASVPNTIAPNTQKTFTFTSGLVTYFKFDETTGQTINDSGGSNSGNLGSNNTAESSDPVRVAGRSGNSLQFDGRDDLATVSNSSSLNNLSSFTYTAWIYPTGFGGSG